MHFISPTQTPTLIGELTAASQSKQICDVWSKRFQNSAHPNTPDVNLAAFPLRLTWTFHVSSYISVTMDLGVIMVIIRSAGKYLQVE